MPHLKEHPLAHRFVVPHGYLLTGETVRVIDWLDRCGERVPDQVPPRTSVCLRMDGRRFFARWDGENFALAENLVAVIRAGRGCKVRLMSADELPAYDLVPVGVIS